MKNNKIIKLLTFLSLMLLLTGVVYSSEKPFFLRGIRALGMGGANIAMSDDQNAFFYNPAGVTERENAMFTLFEIRGSINKDTLDFVDWLGETDTQGNNVQDNLENFDELDSNSKTELLDTITDKISRLNSHITISAPNLNFISGPIGEKTFFGLGVFDEVDLRFNLEAGMLIPNININGQVDVAAMFLLAHKFNDQFSLGLNTKLLNRISIKEDRLNILTLEDFEPTIQPGAGVGADLGATYKLKDNLKFGLQISDVGGTNLKYDRVEEEKEDTTVVKEERSDIIYQRINVGVGYKPLHDFFSNPWIPDTTFALDVRDIMGVDDKDGITEFSQVLKRTHMGAELAWKFINARVGVNSGYPSFGVGFYLWALKFDYAYYVDELGRVPGQTPEQNHIFSVTWRFGTTLKRNK